MRFRGWTIVAAVLLAVAVGVGGYLVGASAAPTDEQAAAVRHQAERAAYADEQGSAFSKGLDKGFPIGQTNGRRQGERDGDAQGATDGRAAAGEQLARAQARRRALRESELTGSGRRLGGSDGLGSLDGSAPASVPSVLASGGDGGILVVGDSLEVLTSPYLKNYLPASKLTVDAVGGYSSLQIFELFQESYDPSQSVIVFDAGTNDSPSYPEILAGRLQAVSKIVGDRCMVVPTIHGLTVDGVNSSGKNRVVQAFAASRPATVTPDWAGFVAVHPELMQPDNLHPTAEGADARAQLIAQAVDACAPFGGF